MRFTLIRLVSILFVAVLVTIVCIFNYENKEFLETWPLNRTRNASAYTIDRGPIYLPKKFCNSEIFAIIIVYSAPKNFELRNVIRSTWASKKLVLNLHIDFYFLIGWANDSIVQLMIEEENVMHDDIILDNFRERYYDLTLKSLHMLKNTALFCSKTAKYLVKIDDDVFLNTQNLVKILSYSDRTNLILGHVFYRATPERHAWNKGYAPYHMYRKYYYPPFVSGTCYAMSIDVVPKLLKVSLTTPLFHLEDVYVTGILAEKAGITLQNNDNFYVDKANFRTCATQNGLENVITTHPYTPEELWEVYNATTVYTRRICWCLFHVVFHKCSITS